MGEVLQLRLLEGGEFGADTHRIEGQGGHALCYRA
jgi:hypothetical protein